jgi:asparagine synthetase B (glutamine-hydrolysing)
MAELWGGISVSKNFRHSIKELQLMPFFNLNSFLQYKLYRLRYRKQFDLATQWLGLNGTTPRTIQMHLGKKYAANTNELLFHYLSTYSLPHLLKYEDRNSMAHSIEARVPFTDFRLVDYVFSIPAAYKIHRGWTKWLLRLAVKDLLPSEIVWRRDKLGFAAPAWISREEVWQTWLERTFPSTRTQCAY